jgi:ABC-type spermidine/putrescine transport system permease subunit I
MVRARGWVAALMTVALLLPLWTSDLVRAFSWIVLLGRQGPVNDALRALGLIDRPLAMLFGDAAVLVGSIHIMLPFMILPLYSVMRGIDTSLIAAANGLGARPLRAFLHVFLPLSLPGVAAGALLVFILATGFYITPATLGGPGQTMIAQLIESVGRVSLNWGLASALAVLLLVATALLLAVYARLVRLRRGGQAA